MSIVETILDIPMEHEKNIYGPFDSFVKKVERTLNVTMISRDGELKLIGPEPMVQKAKSVCHNLIELSKRGNTITEQNVDYALSLVFQEKDGELLEIDKDIICRTINGKPVKPKTIGQKEYVDAIRRRMIVFGLGPAGTGKTYLAMAMAIQAFKDNEVNRIILTRPAIEAGEKLGFLPGDLQSKIDPYLRPLYDALYQIMGADTYLHNAEKGLIEVAPLAYMRGRTLDNAFIILDEAQNTTPAQMKMFLTRIGFGSKVVVTGDMTQRDLPGDVTSGLEVAFKVLKDIEDIAMVRLSSLDIVRHPLVQKIVNAYEEYDARMERRKKTADGRPTGGQAGPPQGGHGPGAGVRYRLEHGKKEKRT
ncbi:MAG: phosphate starvation-inducible protein PhoH [Lachnospiraceae bacterium]|nr:phosphate starvation-inducible protein PhoH [Lachnospiraceae bacterium]